MVSSAERAFAIFTGATLIASCASPEQSKVIATPTYVEGGGVGEISDIEGLAVINPHDASHIESGANLVASKVQEWVTADWGTGAGNSMKFMEVDGKNAKDQLSAAGMMGYFEYGGSGWLMVSLKDNELGYLGVDQSPYIYVQLTESKLGPNFVSAITPLGEKTIFEVDAEGNMVGFLPLGETDWISELGGGLKVNASLQPFKSEILDLIRNGGYYDPAKRGYVDASGNVVFAVTIDGMVDPVGEIATGAATTEGPVIVNGNETVEPTVVDWDSMEATSELVTGSTDGEGKINIYNFYDRAGVALDKLDFASVRARELNGVKYVSYKNTSGQNFNFMFDESEGKWISLGGEVNDKGNVELSKDGQLLWTLENVPEGVIVTLEDGSVLRMDGAVPQFMQDLREGRQIELLVKEYVKYDVRENVNAEAEQVMVGEYAGVKGTFSLLTANHLPQLEKVTIKPGTENRYAEAIYRELYRVWRNRGGVDGNGPTEDIDFATYMKWWKEAQTGIPTIEGETPHTMVDVQIWLNFFDAEDMNQSVEKPIWFFYEGEAPEGVVVINKFTQKLVDKSQTEGMAEVGIFGEGWRGVHDGNEFVAEIGLPLEVYYYKVNSLSDYMGAIGSFMIQDHGQSTGYNLSDASIVPEAKNIYLNILSPEKK